MWIRTDRDARDVPADTLSYEWDCDYDGVTFTPDFSDEGGACAVSGSGSDVPADTLSYEWDCDYDGVTFTSDFSGQAGSCTYPDGPASHTAAIRVCDDDGDCTIDTASVTVNNVAATVGAVSCTPEPSDEGSSVTCSASFTDGGANDAPFTCTVDHGDGSGPQAGTVTGLTCDGPAHTYTDDGNHTVTVCVTDKDLDTGCNSTTHVVDNVAPSVGAVTCSPAAPQDGSPVTCSAGFTDPGTNDAPFTCTVDYGDGSGAQAGTVVGSTCNGPAHVYSTPDTYTVTVCVTDKDAETGCNSTSLVVSASAPTVPAECAGMTFDSTITGTPGNDVIYGTSGRDMIFGLGGDDLIYGLGGDDCIDGGAGNDELYGGNNNDAIVGGDDNDEMYGENGDDRLYGGNHNDYMYGGNGNDTS